MIKVVNLLKRREGMSLEEFRAYYENVHEKLGRRFMPEAIRYVRRYVTAEPVPMGVPLSPVDFDVIMEAWFETRADFEAVLRRLSDPVYAAIMAADEDQLFDRRYNRVVTVEECESILD